LFYHERTSEPFNLGGWAAFGEQITTTQTTTKIKGLAFGEQMTTTQTTTKIERAAFGVQMSIKICW
jgi:hypothetical protein